jgi:hypothetical protein
MMWPTSHASHAIPGRTGRTLLDEEIIRVCCPMCNIWKCGNYAEFIPRLIREKALVMANPVENREAEALKWWESKLLSAKQVKKWTRPELEAKCEEYRTRIAALGA